LVLRYVISQFKKHKTPFFFFKELQIEGNFTMSVQVIISINLILFLTWRGYIGSSQGRGPRAAGWFADHLAEQGDSNMQSLVLEGGIKGWATAGPKYTDFMDEYEAQAWKEFEHQ
jgi:hypothetical protein